MEWAARSNPSFTGRGERGSFAAFARASRVPGAWVRLLVQKRVSLGAAAVICVAGGSVLQAAEAYLPLNGPTPLRFSTISGKAKTFLWPPLFPVKPGPCPSNVVAQVADSDATTLPSPTPPSLGFDRAATNDLFEPVLPQPLAADIAPSAPSLFQPGGEISPAQEAPAATTQSIEDFFNPETAAGAGYQTNDVSRRALWFQPPTPRSISGSQAIYRTP